MDFDLSDEQRLVRETARAFADKEIAPRARDNARNEHFDLELVGRIADPALRSGGLDRLTLGPAARDDAHGMPVRRELARQGQTATAAADKQDAHEARV